MDGSPFGPVADLGDQYFEVGDQAAIHARLSCTFLFRTAGRMPKGDPMTHLRTIVAMAFALAASGHAQAQQKISIPSVTPASLFALLHHDTMPATVTGELYLPPKASGPVPAMVLKHGSGGLDGPTGTNIRKWAATFAGWGIAAFVVDSFGPRGIKETATNQGQLSSWADVADALAALQILGADPRIDKNRIGIVGWSRGAGVAVDTALETVRKSVIKDDLKFALHVAFYAPADVQYRDRATDMSPMMFFHGEADNYTPIGPVREFSDWAQSQGNPVSFIAYPKSYHDFDVQGGFSGFVKTFEVFVKCDLVLDLTNGHALRMNHSDNPKVTADDIRTYLKSCGTHGANLAYNAAARADAVEKLHGFLKQYFQISG
jgi:dienelactone hydrolase